MGAADLKPYPLPVNKIDVSEEINIPQFKPLDKEQNINSEDKVNYDRNKFEHLGAGVMLKKPNETVELTTIIAELKNSSDPTQPTTPLDSTLFDELVTETEKSPIYDEKDISLTTEKLSFLNMKDFIVQRQNKNSTLPPFTESSQKSHSKEPQLFPSISKWEFVNGTESTKKDLNITKKFNQTLQASLKQ